MSSLGKKPGEFSGVDVVENVVDQLEDVRARLPPEDHPIRQFEHVAARGISSEVHGERMHGTDQLAALEEHQVRVGPQLEHGTDLDEWLEGSRKAAAGILGPLGDARDLAVIRREQRCEPVGLALGSSAQHECRSADLGRHSSRVGPPQELPPVRAQGNLDKQGSSPYLPAG